MLTPLCRDSWEPNGKSFSVSWAKILQIHEQNVLMLSTEVDSLLLPPKWNAYRAAKCEDIAYGHKRGNDHWGTQGIIKV